VKYVNEDDVNHLIASIKTTYTLTKDWTEDLYCRIVLSWDYINRTVDILMPGYVKKKLLLCSNKIHNLTNFFLGLWAELILSPKPQYIKNASVEMRQNELGTLMGKPPHCFLI
jgi:hypothetical protein